MGSVVQNSHSFLSAFYTVLTADLIFICLVYQNFTITQYNFLSFLLYIPTEKKYSNHSSWLTMTWAEKDSFDFHSNFDLQTTIHIIWIMGA